MKAPWSIGKNDLHLELPAVKRLVFRGEIGTFALEEEHKLHPDFRILEGEYLKDLLAQPEALAETLDKLEVSTQLASVARHLDKGQFQRIVLTGMGSSFHVLYPLHLELLKQGVASIMAETAELVHYMKELFSPQTLIVAVSQSGWSAEIIRMLKLNRGRATVVAVTNTVDSPLAQKADATLLTYAGSEFSVSCKTYVTALMVLEWLGRILGGGDLRRARRELKLAGPAVSWYLTHWKDHVAALLKHLHNSRHLFLVGRGKSLAAACTGALIIKESDHFHAEGMSSASFRHGPLEMTDPQVFVLVFAGGPPTRQLNDRLREDVIKRRGQSHLVAENATLQPFRLPAVPPIVLPIAEILVPEMITLALAAQANREPGRFERATKITTTE
jgi:glutamine---fructose-6-phosphate transaminase (isomerizing)